MFQATGEAIGSLPVAEAKARLNAGPAATGGRKGGETGEGASLANSLDDNRRNQMKGYNEDQGKQRWSGQKIRFAEYPPVAIVR